MTDDFSDIDNAIFVALGRKPLPSRRRRLAAFLRQIAEREERLADIAAEDARRAPGRRLSEITHSRQAGPGLPPGDFLRIHRAAHGARERLIVYIGRGVYYALDSPARLDVQRIGGRPALVVVRGHAGYAVVVRQGTMPRITCTAAGDLLGLDDGRYAADVQGQIVFFSARL